MGCQISLEKVFTDQRIVGYGLAYIDSSTVFKRRLIKARINVIYLASALKSVLFRKENEINDLRRSVCTCNHGTENHRY